MIRDAINRNVLAKDDALPAERDLAIEYDVSRITVRKAIGGLVEEGSLVRGEGTHVTFSVTDTNETIPVRFEGVLPDLFGESQGMIGTGSLQDGVFVATEILAKHDESYMPKEVVDALKEQGLYKEPES